MEIVLVNDGGCNVAEVAGEVSRQLRVDQIDLNPSRGRCAAGNAALNRARGEWLTFLDDDDLMLPRAISARMAAVAPSQIPYGRVPVYRCTGGQPEFVREFAQPFDRFLLLFENYLPICAPLIPAAKVRELGGFDESLDSFEDWDLFLRLSDLAEFVLIDEEVAEYRIFEWGAFIDGKGGIDAQVRGLEAFYRKHHHRLTPEVLARVQVAVKTQFFPRIDATVPNRLRSEVQDLRRRVGRIRKDAGLESGTSVIIVNYNGINHLKGCLPSLYRSAEAAFEVVVVDNGSTDGSAEWIRENWPQVKLVTLDENVGFGEGNRWGVQVAKGRFIAFLNSDTVVEPGWLDPLLEAVANNDDVAAACSALRLLDNPGLINARGGGMMLTGYGIDHQFQYPWDHPWHRQGSGPREVLFPTAASMVMSRETFLSIGGFDPAMFMYHEDVDLGWRLWLLGRRVLVCPDSVVNHGFLGTSGPRRGLQWRARMGLRHCVRSLIVNYELVNLARALKALAKILWRERAFILAFHVGTWNLRHILGTLRRRRWVQQNRVRNDDELFQKGLVSRLPIPATPPERPVGGVNHRDFFRTPLLLLGQHSAFGRLGAGWFAPESVAGRRARWTTGSASAWLFVSPNSCGRLVMSVFRPAGTGYLAPLQVRANETTRRIPVGEGTWAAMNIHCESDSEGVISVEIVAPEFPSHESWRRWDARHLGVAIERIEFVPDLPQNKWVPASVAVIVPTYNRWAFLEETLEALASQTRRPDEVLVVDDGSTDSTLEQLKSWQRQNGQRLSLRVLHQENARQGAARNLALRHATSEIILFLGDDIVPDPGCVAAHLEAHRRLGAGAAVLGLIDWHEKGVRVTPFLRYVHLDGAQFAFAHMVDGEDLPFTNFYTSNISLAREILGEEPFDSAFTSYGWEDIEIGWRLSLRGVRIVYQTQARAQHRHPMTFRGFLARQRHVGSTLGTLFRVRPELMGNAWLPNPETPGRFRYFRHLFRLIVPLLATLDWCMIPLPWRIYRQLVQWAFYEGFREPSSCGGDTPRAPS